MLDTYSRPHRLLGIVFTSLAFFSGCSGPSYEIAEVEGTLLINGKPGHKVHIEFVPEEMEGVISPPSSLADTDEQGKFSLYVMTGDLRSAPTGAVVGNHRVVLSDLQLAESEDGQGVPIRFDSSYSMVDSTPLKQQVKPGKQVIELTIP